MIYLIYSCSLLSMSLLIGYVLLAFSILFKFCQMFIDMILGRRVKVIMVYDLLDTVQRSVRSGAKSWNTFP